MNTAYFDEYQDWTLGLAKYRANVPQGNWFNNLVYVTLGLTGEAGEAAEVIKKVLRNDCGKLTEEARQKLKYELGDVLYYLARVAAEAGFPLSEIAQGNVEKLEDRKKRDVLCGEGDTR